MVDLPVSDKILIEAIHGDHVLLRNDEFAHVCILNKALAVRALRQRHHAML